MFKILALIGIMLADNPFAAHITPESFEAIDEKIIFASAFEMIAQLAILENGNREALNASLISQFGETGADIFFDLRPLKTKEEAIDARNYYRSEKNRLSHQRETLMAVLANNMAKAE